MILKITKSTPTVTFRKSEIHDQKLDNVKSILRNLLILSKEL